MGLLINTEAKNRPGSASEEVAEEQRPGSGFAGAEEIEASSAVLGLRWSLELSEPQIEGPNQAQTAACLLQVACCRWPSQFVRITYLERGALAGRGLDSLLYVVFTDDEGELPWPMALF